MNPEALRNIKNLAAELAVGEQLSGQLCPYCKGGSTKEESFSIKRERYAASYTCHRATCDTKGRVIIGEGNEMEGIRRPKRAKFEIPSSQIHPSLRPLNDDQLAYLNATFGFEQRDITRANWLWDNGHNRMYMPIFGPKREYVGHVLRSFDKNSKRKALTIVTSPDIPVACFYFPFVSDTQLVLVEDQLSANKVARQTNSCALLGTNISEELIALIKKYNFRRIVAVFDKDAFNKGLKYQKQYSELFDEFVVKQPERDLKYLSDNAISELIK